MRRRHLFWQIYLPLLAVTIVALVSFTWLAKDTLHDMDLQQMTSDLRSRARILAEHIDPLLANGNTAAMEAYVRRQGSASDTRITVIRDDGTVWGDSMEDPFRMENHADRPEIVAARRGGTGSAVRYSYTISRTMLYVAVRLGEADAPRGYVRTAVSLARLEEAEARLTMHLYTGGALLALFSGLLVFLFMRQLVKPIERIRQGAERFARGEFDVRVPVSKTLELGELAVSLNDMAHQLDERIRTITEQHSQQQAMLASMMEGVLAVDKDERIIIINKALGAMLGIDAASAAHRSMQEVLRISDLQRFAAHALESADPIEGFITIPGQDEDRHLQAHGTLLRSARGDAMGAVIVLNDITRLRKLENMRREFVSNVSHELKTPITSIKGFVETLQTGALDNREDAERFLAIIARQADRLHMIIEDLLSLSRIEQEEEREGIVREVTDIAELMRSAAQNCEVQASERRITFLIDCPEGLSANINPHLVEQALVNLINNAIKYSEDGAEIRISARATGGDLQLTVQDSGIGIEKEHLPRLFERFYRVDKARSRTMGGTGLGLAIVKHIAQAHGGSVDVQSTPGKGSTFTITLTRV